MLKSFLSISFAPFLSFSSSKSIHTSEFFFFFFLVQWWNFILITPNICTNTRYHYICYGQSHKQISNTSKYIYIRYAQHTSDNTKQGYTIVFFTWSSIPFHHSEQSLDKYKWCFFAALWLFYLLLHITTLNLNRCMLINRVWRHLTTIK